MEFQLLVKLVKLSDLVEYRVQSYIFFCRCANFGVSLQHIRVENKNYITLYQKNAKIFNIAVVNRIGSASNG